MRAPRSLPTITPPPRSPSRLRAPPRTSQPRSAFPCAVRSPPCSAARPPSSAAATSSAFQRLVPLRLGCGRHSFLPFWSLSTELLPHPSLYTPTSLPPWSRDYYPVTPTAPTPASLPKPTQRIFSASISGRK
ncbi:hypothetical protein Syun_014478 [Stephania yunnanensis]|uniref:Uncharacterized protein n=1 Tax=Stephania yunnanensis TaxID=152371 RepID=A0AAP0JJF1_9MAGN